MNKIKLDNLKHQVMINHTFLDILCTLKSNPDFTGLIECKRNLKFIPPFPQSLSNSRHWKRAYKVKNIVIKNKEGIVIPFSKKDIVRLCTLLTSIAANNDKENSFIILWRSGYLKEVTAQQIDFEYMRSIISFMKLLPKIDIKSIDKEIFALISEHEISKEKKKLEANIHPIQAPRPSEKEIKV